MKTLYLAKEPDAGVRNDFANINGEITIVDCLNGYLDWYRKKSYNCISKTKYFELDGTMLFDAVVGNPPYQGKTKVINKDGVSYHNLEEGMPLTGDALTTYSILEKIAKSNHSRIPLQMGQDIAKEDYIEDGKFAVYSSGQVVKHTNIVPNTPNCLKFVVPFSSSYKGRFTTTGHIGMLNVWCSIRSEDEGDHLKSIIDHPLMQFYIERYKKTSGFTPAVKNAMIPMLESTENIHQQFNLSPEEVQYLSNNNYA